MTDLTRCKEFLRNSTIASRENLKEWADEINVLEFRANREERARYKAELQLDRFAMLSLWGRIKFLITRRFPEETK